MSKPKIIAIIGPTASGKSALGAFLAGKIKGEIISADSRHIYREMEVISRAPNKKEISALPHHMVGVADPRRTYSAGAYVKEATRAINKIVRQQKVPVVVGGTGFYADSLLRGITLPQVAPNKTLRATLAKKTPTQLLVQLRKIDPTSATRVDPKNIVRLVRAIEIATALGAVPALESNSVYDVLWLGLLPAQDAHEKAIRKGVIERLKKGMVREAKKLRTTLTRKRYESLGFEFILLAQYLDTEITKKELVEALVRGEKQYSKRQLRWFTRNKDIHWIQNKKEALKRTKEFLR